MLRRLTGRPAPTAHIQRALAARWAQLIGGFLLLGLAITLMIRSGLGLGPWDAFHVGLGRLAGISVGAASVLTGLVIILLSLPAGLRPRPGTLANMVFIGPFSDLMLPLVPPAHGLVAGLACYAAAFPVMGVATGMYIAARLGSGPRDGVMLALVRRTGWPVRRVRTFIELSVLGAGWAMGGTIGLGTLLIALFAGPSVQWGLQWFDVLPSSATPRAHGAAAGAGRRRDAA